VVAHLLWEQEVGGSSPPSPTVIPSLDRRAATRALTRVALRSFVGVVVVLVAYYNVPLTVDSEISTTLRFAAVIVAIVAIVVWQVHAIVKADTPLLRAVQALAVTVTLAVASFAYVYVVFSNNDPGSFNEPLTKTDALYFTVTTLATVGYGDIHASSETARIVVTLQMVFNVAVIGVTVRLLTEAARRGRFNRSESAGLPSSDDPRV
jgi:voltage-gated potassium channel